MIRTVKQIQQSELSITNTGALGTEGFSVSRIQTEMRGSKRISFADGFSSSVVTDSLKRFIHNGMFYGSKAKARRFWKATKKAVTSSDPLASKRRLKNLFANLRNGHDGESEKVARSQRMAKEVLSLFDGIAEIDVKGYLDLGCGPGDVTREVGKILQLDEGLVYGMDVYATDTVEGYQRIVNTQSTIPLKDHSIGLISAFMMLHHIRDLNLFLKEVHRVLQPGGFLVVRDHDCYSIEIAYFNKFIDELYQDIFNGHTRTPLTPNYLSADKWQDYFEQHGFQLKKVNYHTGNNPFVPFYMILQKVDS